MSKKRWFRLYIERWRDGTFGLNPNEIAAYITVLCELYDHDGFLANPDYEVMARRCGMRPSSFRKALDGLLSRRKLSLDDGILSSKAVSEEIKSREKLDEKSEESRRNLAEKRKEYSTIASKIPSNKEERIQNNRTLEVSALHPMPGSREENPSPAVENFLKRREMRRRGRVA